MRSKNAFKTLIMYFCYEGFIMILGLIFPRFIIATYGSEVNGLSETITRMLSLINLIQAGAVGTAIYQMYKPVAENDYETQSAIIYSSKKYYKKFVCIYMTLAIGLSIFYGFRLRSPILAMWEIIFAFVVLALNGSFTLYFNSYVDIYISPHQKKYYITISNIVSKAVNYGLLTIVLIFKLHFIFIYVAILAGGVSGTALNLIFYRKFSKGKINPSPANKNYPINDRKYLMMSSIGGEAVTASPTVIITTIIGTAYSSVFGVYSMIFVSMKTVLNSIQLSISAIFGNLTKTADDKRIAEVYGVVELVTILIGAVLASCTGFLLMPFVGIYISNADMNYIYPILGIFVTAYIAMFAFRTSFAYVATVYGLFKKICKITLGFGLTGIVISILCVRFFGMPYVMVGLLFNQLGCAVTTLVVLKKDIPWFRIGKLLRRSAVMFALTIISTVVYFVTKPPINGWVSWFLSAIAVAMAVILVLAVYCLIFERKEIKMLFSYVKAFFGKSKKRADSAVK